MKRAWILLVLVAVFGFSGPANATLTTIGTATYNSNTYNLIYEDDQGLVWLDYTHSQALWGPQGTWASTLGSDLTVTLNPGYSTTIDWTTGWRLPIAGNTPEEGFYDTSGEMGHLYYVSLGNTAGGFDPYTTGPFVNLLRNDYWLGTVYSADNSKAWYYNFNRGYMDEDNKSAFYWGLAVRAGDVVSAAPVPEPATMLLLGSGLIGLAVYGRKKFFKK